MSERLMPLPPDPIVLMMILAESIELGHASSEKGFAWAIEQGYIEIVDEENFRILDAGRRTRCRSSRIPGVELGESVMSSFTPRSDRDVDAAASGWNGTLRLPFEWAVLVSIHPRWQDKDGCRWHIQAWHPSRRGFVLSRLGVVR